jgi:TetR/AcrR family transcriptional repressor of mexJK operon
MKPLNRSKRGRPTDPHKSDQIIEIAGELFMSKGFHATRMEDIAELARMSKLTLYRRFPNKESLFVAVIRSKCDRHLPDELFDVFDQKPPIEAIFTFTKALISLIFSEEPVSMYRMLGSVAKTNPELTKLFYESGPKPIKAQLREKLKKLSDKGLLKIDDPQLAQEMLTSMIQGSDMHAQLFLNIGKKPRTTEIDSLAKKITKNFMRCWGGDTNGKSI